MEVKHTEGYDCIDDNLKIVLKNKNVDIRKIFSNLWYFEFDENAETLGKGLMQRIDNKYEKLKQDFNINYTIYENKDRNNEIVLKDFGVSSKLEINEIDKIIAEKCNNDNILIVELDTFKYKYDKGFQKYIGTHSCVITEKKGEKAQIIDVWYNLYNKEIEYKVLLNAITRMVVLDISNIKEKEFNYSKLKTQILDEKSVIEMKTFFKKVIKIDLQKEYLGLDFEMVFKAPIDKGLRNIIMNRQRFAYYLYYLSEQLNNIKIREIGECIFLMSMDWTKLRSILVQSYFLNKEIKLDQINGITENILKKEIRIKKKIEEIKW